MKRSAKLRTTFVFFILSLTLCCCSNASTDSPQNNYQSSQTAPPLSSQQRAETAAPHSALPAPHPEYADAAPPEILPEAPESLAPTEPESIPAPAPEPEPAITVKQEVKAQDPKPAKKTEKPATSVRQASPNKKLTLSQLVKKYPDLLLLKGKAESKQVALTFDDAPDDTYTPQVLDTLKKHNVKATFFLVGSLAEKHPDIVKRIVREGHIIGNHTYQHKLLTKMSDESFQEEIQQTQTILEAICGYKPRLIRPPYGEISESQLLWASENDYRIVNWNVDSNDWRQLSESEVTANILKDAKAGSIILQHSGGAPGQDLSGTVNALPKIIEKLQNKGFKLVTLPELLHESKQK